MNLLDAALDQFSKLTSDTQKIIQAVEKNVDGIEWKEKRISRKRRMPSELPQDKPTISTEAKWQSEVFYTAVYSVIARINEHFSSS